MRKIGIAAVVVALSALVVSGAWARSQASSSVTASAKGQRLSETTWVVTVSGKVASPDKACRENRAVRVEFVFPTPPSIVAKAKTATNGTYSGMAHLNPGADEADTAQSIKVVVPKATAGGVTCKEATKTIAVPRP
jgi:hypothetical protein